MFDELRLPVTLSYRFIFKEFVEQILVATAAFRLNCDWHTVVQHYAFARNCIHIDMERLWLAFPKG
jgi:hypothetical protein